MYLCVKGIDFGSLYDLDILFWNCSESVVLFCFSIVILLLQKQTFHIVTYFFTCFFSDHNGRIDRYLKYEI